MTSRPDADVEELTVKTARVHRSLTQIRGRATSSDGGVTIEVSIDGRITDMVVSQWFSQASADAAAAEIARTHGEALADAEATASAIRRELTEDYRVARIVDRIATEQPPLDVDDKRSDDRKVHLRQMVTGPVERRSVAGSADNEVDRAEGPLGRSLSAPRTIDLIIWNPLPSHREQPGTGSQLN